MVVRDQNCEDEFVGHQNRTTTSGFTRMRRKSPMQRIGQKIDIQEQYPHNRVLANISHIYRFYDMPDRMAWSDLIPEVVFWPFLRMRSANRPQSALKIAFSATISQTYRFSGMPDQMAWSDLIPEVVLWPFLRMRSKNLAQSPPEIAFLTKISWLYRFSTMPD